MKKQKIKDLPKKKTISKKDMKTVKGGGIFVKIGAKEKFKFDKASPLLERK